MNSALLILVFVYLQKQQKWRKTEEAFEMEKSDSFNVLIHIYALICWVKYADKFALFTMIVDSYIWSKLFQAALFATVQDNVSSSSSPWPVPSWCALWSPGGCCSPGAASGSCRSSCHPLPVCCSHCCSGCLCWPTCWGWSGCCPGCSSCSSPPRCPAGERSRVFRKRLILNHFCLKF